jgi:geranylgeranyl diphosphate synthase, type II
MDISKHLISQKNLIDSHLDFLIPQKDKLHEAARYSLLGTAKRIRPILTLATTQALNGSLKSALSPACALEMVHTYSLIHDDLPCMDNDDFRRGKPTLHKAFGEAEAVLTGDFLLTHAFQTISDAPEISPDQKVSLT